MFPSQVNDTGIVFYLYKTQFLWLEYLRVLHLQQLLQQDHFYAHATLQQWTKPVRCHKAYSSRLHFVYWVVEGLASYSFERQIIKEVNYPFLPASIQVELQ